MHRREVITLIGGAVAAWPLKARAEQKKMPVIGFLGSASPGPFAPFVAAFRQGLNETGYVEGQNVTIEYRWAENHSDQLSALAGDLVGRKVDLIVSSGSLLAALAAKNATSTIPIVFTAISDPVPAGLVASLAHPGGNITGSSPFQFELMPKRLELLTELVPQARLIALLVNPDDPRAEGLSGDMREAARVRGVQLHILKASTVGEIETAFTALIQLPAAALVVSSDPLFSSQRAQFVELASRHAVPVIYPWREVTASGGLISYGPSTSVLYRQAGIYAGRILKGEKPADLPVQRPTTFELVVNLKTAKALGLTVPPSILARVDEVIE
jgi:putative ABC transport system substrate-binding protein